MSFDVAAVLWPLAASLAAFCARDGWKATLASRERLAASENAYRAKPEDPGPELDRRIRELESQVARHIMAQGISRR